MNIGQLARATGVPVDTIRYYEREQVLPPARRRPNGYRDYAAEDARRLRFIRRAKELGFALEEIRGLLDLGEKGDAGGADMAAVRSAAREKLALVEARIAELARVRDALRDLVEACPGHGALTGCPIMAALAGEAA
ncbi:heavy metal-responsive transcriptional regulator [Pseudoxanthomonas koreensis]|uniref:heavy metal-responsive transcriptional regulator n=1 Tax=Pseudoxanthomonas koreensis TaxID=266061 RepID=UPI001391B2FD|nr:heavy metal-responsive transcriptional regulator [Pseudoxanthomonas koreensis]KAF1693399.1 heavy metal-responsive transcriptional regulator [Pseudoxanthomonas koreensis]